MRYCEGCETMHGNTCEVFGALAEAYKQTNINSFIVCRSLPSQMKDIKRDDALPCLCESRCRKFGQTIPHCTGCNGNGFHLVTCTTAVRNDPTANFKQPTYSRCPMPSCTKDDGCKACNPQHKETILQEAQRIVHGDRGDDYGHPIDDFTRTGRMWGALLGIGDIDPRLVAVMMVAVKLSREVNKHKRDNFTDIAGYAECGQMVADKQVA